MAADLTTFDRALKAEMVAMLEDYCGKPYPGPGRVIELTPKQVRENADWRRRAKEAQEFVSSAVDSVIAEAKARFDMDVYGEEGSWEVSSYEPHSPKFIPDDQEAYDQWRRDHPGEFGRVLFALKRK